MNFFTEFNDSVALVWTERLLALAVIQQTAELLAIRPHLTQPGPWNWDTLRNDFRSFPTWLQRILGAFLGDTRFQWLLFVRLGVALLVLIHPMAAGFAILWLGSLAISWRWRGSSNGGSDFMMLILLTAGTVTECFPNSTKLRTACLLYISLQASASYFLAGWIKLRTANWRSGKALIGFLKAVEPPVSQRILSNLRLPAFALSASWSVIGFECLFPIVFAFPDLAAPLLGVGLCFHLMNFWVFGLNRFVWVWAATYPAIFFIAHARLF